MPVTHLVNTKARGGTALLDLLEAEAESTGARGRRIFQAITCYYDQRALFDLGTRVAAAVTRAGGYLDGFEIAIDVGDWLKQRTDRSSLERDLADRIGLEPEQVQVQPINVASRLVHAKGYALIGRSTGRSRKLTGFVAITSGNLTSRGLGLQKRESNIEIAHISRDPDALQSFQEQFCWLTKQKPSSSRLEDHKDYLLALKILGRGRFYHKWEGNLSAEVRFSIKLTPTGRRALSGGSEPLFREYESESNSLSREPLNISEAFRKQAKPFPKRFWAIFSVDTLLGRWVPLEIADQIDAVLAGAAEPYLKAIREQAGPSRLASAENELKDSVAQLRSKGWISQDDNTIDSWRKRVESFRANDELIKAFIYNYEPVPEVLEDAGRNLTIRTFRSLRSRLSMKSSRKQGVRAALACAIADDAAQLMDDLQRLSDDARNALARHGGAH